jgi:copper homeostasis protein CutC
MKKSELKQIIKEEIEAILVDKNTEHYMFFENLEIIKNGVEELMKMDKDKIEVLLSNGHDWANDHIATSKDDVEEVHNFFKTKMSSMNEKMLSDKQKKISSAAPPADKITGADFAALRKK